MESILLAVDFWFWTLVPAIMLLAIVTAIPAAVILGLMVSGRAKEETRSSRV